MITELTERLIIYLTYIIYYVLPMAIYSCLSRYIFPTLLHLPIHDLWDSLYVNIVYTHIYNLHLLVFN